MEIDMMKEPDVMVYLMTGFLDSGKTQFLNFTLSQDYFQIDGKTLLILCEEGEEEYGAHPILSIAVVIPDSFAARRRSLANFGWQRLSPPESVSPPPVLL